MRTTTLALACLLALAGVAVAAVPVAAADDVPSGSCTLSYPGSCTVRAGDTRLNCSGVGSVPDCRS